MVTPYDNIRYCDSYKIVDTSDLNKLTWHIKECLETGGKRINDNLYFLQSQNGIEYFVQHSGDFALIYQEDKNISQEIIQELGLEGKLTPMRMN